MVQRRVIGSYDTEAEAIAAIEDLKRQGYSSDDISVMSKHTENAEIIADETGPMRRMAQRPGPQQAAFLAVSVAYWQESVHSPFRESVQSSRPVQLLQASPERQPGPE